MQCKRACPLYPRERTFAVHSLMSALGQKRTSISYAAIGLSSAVKSQDRGTCVQSLSGAMSPKAQLTETARAAGKDRARRGHLLIEMPLYTSALVMSASLTGCTRGNWVDKKGDQRGSPRP
jgi:hypothetical protein